MPMAVSRPGGDASDLRRAAVCIRRSHDGLQPSGHPRAGGERCRRGPVGRFACLGRIRCGVSEPPHRRSSRFAVDGCAGYPVRQGDLGGLYSAGFRAGLEGRTPAAGRRLLQPAVPHRRRHCVFRLERHAFRRGVRRGSCQARGSGGKPSRSSIRRKTMRNFCCARCCR
jgi:hypothetical protein